MFHVAEYVVQGSLINPTESKKRICISVTKLRQEALIFLPCFSDDAKSTFYARPCVSVCDFQGDQKHLLPLIPSLNRPITFVK